MCHKSYLDVIPYKVMIKLRSIGTFSGTGIGTAWIYFAIYYYAYIFHILWSICELKNNYDKAHPFLLNGL